MFHFASQFSLFWLEAKKLRYWHWQKTRKIITLLFLRVLTSVKTSFKFVWPVRKLKVIITVVSVVNIAFKSFCIQKL